MPRHYMDDGTVTSNTSSSDQVHYLHNGTVRSKLIVLKPESTFTSESDRRNHHNITEGLNGLSPPEKKGSYPLTDLGSHARLSLLDSRFTSGRMLPRKRCTRKLCLCFAVAVVSVVFGAAIGVYFGFRILEADTTKVKEFRGAFRVISGDNYTEELVDIFSDAFLSRSRLYKAKLDTTLSNSVLKKAYLGSEILAIDPGESDRNTDLIVRFNIRMDPSKIDVDAGDIYLVLINEIMKGQSRLMKGLRVDEDSIEVHERRSKFIPNRVKSVANIQTGNSNPDAFQLVTFTSHKDMSTPAQATTTPDSGGGPTFASDRSHGVIADSSRITSLFGINSNVLQAILSGTRAPSTMTRNDHQPQESVARLPAFMSYDPRWNSTSGPIRAPEMPFGMRNPVQSTRLTIQRLPGTADLGVPTRTYGVPRAPPAKRPPTGLSQDGDLSSQESVTEIIPIGQPRTERPASADQQPEEESHMVNAILGGSEDVRPKIGHGHLVVKSSRLRPDVVNGASVGLIRGTVGPQHRAFGNGGLVQPPRIFSITELRRRTTTTSSPSTRMVLDTNSRESFVPPPQRVATVTTPPRATSKSELRTTALTNAAASTKSTPLANLRKWTTHRAEAGERTTKRVPTATLTTEQTAVASERPGHSMPASNATANSPFNMASLSSRLLPFLPLIVQKRQCVPPELNLCAGITKNLSSLPSMSSILERAGIRPVFEFVRSVLESGCFEYAHHFICQLLQPGCDNGKPVLPCRTFCENFLDKCRHVLPQALYRGLTCNILPDDMDRKCVDTPECVHELRSRGQNYLVCDGIVDCHDMSDETRCGWCKPGQFVCGGRQCVDVSSRCDGKPDCPNEADERNCLALADSAAEAAHAHPYTSEGFVFLNDKGAMGKICADTLMKSIPKDRREVVLKNVGESACELLHFRHLAFVDTKTDVDKNGPYFHILNPLSWKVTFLEAPCQSKQVVHVGCTNFVCGKRPSRTPDHMIRFLDHSKYAALVDHGDWPWHTALYNDGNHICDATLIHEEWLLTSSTCFQGLPRGRWVARIGIVRLDSNAPFQQRRRIIARSPSPIKGSDIVLAKLEQPVRLTDFVRPVCLPRTDNLFPTGKKCIALGWDLPRNHLRQVTVILTETEECLWRWPVGKLHVFCTSEPAELINDCQSEDQSGGPLLCDDDGTWYIAGMVNWRIGCGLAKQPRLYDSVAVNANWILTTIRNHKHVPAISQEIVDM